MANRHRTGDAAHSSRPPVPAASAPALKPPVLPLPTIPASPPPTISPTPRVRAYKTLPRHMSEQSNRDLVVRFGQILRAARLRRGYSQQDLATRAAMYRTHISLIEVGTRNIQITTICTLAAALRVNPGDLMPVLFLPENTAITPPASIAPTPPAHL